MLRILLVAVFGTDHIEKAVCMISAWIFSENVGGMKLKFGEEIEQHLTDRSRRQICEIFSSLALILV